MVKTLHQMSSFDASAHPGPEFEEEQAWEATRQQTSMATQVMADSTSDLPKSQQQGGRRVSDAQWEIFVACEAAEALHGGVDGPASSIGIGSVAMSVTSATFSRTVKLGIRL